ncbi:MAG: hydantoinase B/oxoprolinase family protein, partial [Pseudomonadota bacterium]
SMREQSLETLFDANGLKIANDAVTHLSKQASDDLARQSIPDIILEKTLHLRYDGSDTVLEVPLASMDAMHAEFTRQHKERFGFVLEGRSITISACMVEAVGVNARTDLPEWPQGGDATPARHVTTHMVGSDHNTPIYRRDDLGQQARITGPAIIAEDTATVIIEPDWQASFTHDGTMMLERITPLARELAIGTQCDPVMLEVFNNLFMSIAEQMGFTLQNTAHSVNIKERLDFSCAIFDAQAQLIANAPHMPVHLGSMGESVLAIARQNTLHPGDVYALNAPYNGGTHLPDITVVTPIFDQDGTSILFYVASRGHHADVGGSSPGSMPCDSQDVEQEGVLIDNFQLVKQGVFQEQALRDLLTNARWPARNPHQNIADLQAQIAANENGVAGLMKMIGQFGLATVQSYMGHVQDNAQEAVRRSLGSLRSGSYAYKMDDGGVVKVAIAIDQDKREACVDFTGTSAVRDSNFNAPSSICRAAVLYVFRTLVDQNIPMNEGCLKPIEIIIPEGSMLAPTYPAAVVAGNVETSQVIVDTIYAALGVMAGAQGTMNNITFGNANYQYYETLCGGTGAGPGFHGTDAVHTHMTNSRLTDPEILELRFPVRLESFSIRSNSGGYGQYHGGAG